MISPVNASYLFFADGSLPCGKTPARRFPGKQNFHAVFIETQGSQTVECVAPYGRTYGAAQGASILFVRAQNLLPGSGRREVDGPRSGLAKLPQLSAQNFSIQGHNVSRYGSICANRTDRQGGRFYAASSSFSGYCYKNKALSPAACMDLFERCYPRNLFSALGGVLSSRTRSKPGAIPRLSPASVIIPQSFRKKT
jgi:hypothetical protein